RKADGEARQHQQPKRNGAARFGGGHELSPLRDLCLGPPVPGRPERGSRRRGRGSSAEGRRPDQLRMTTVSATTAAATQKRAGRRMSWSSMLFITLSV